MMEPQEMTATSNQPDGSIDYQIAENGDYMQTCHYDRQATLCIPPALVIMPWEVSPTREQGVF